MRVPYALTLSFAIGFFLVSTLSAQTPACVPNQLYKDSTSGVFPSPTEGIKTAACVGKPYNLVFTLIADKITYGGITFPINKIVLDTAKAVSGLPTGLTYACNPPTCIFAPKVLGCAVIRGTVNDTVKPRIFPLVITGKADVGLPADITVSFPGSFFPGSYDLPVLAKNDPKCTTTAGVNDLKNAVSTLKTSPNPVSDNLVVSTEILTAGNYQTFVSDLVGRTISIQTVNLSLGENNFTLNTNALNDGLYFLNMAQNGVVLNTQKFVVQK